MKMYLKGFPLKRPPDSIDEQGRAVFEIEDFEVAAEKARQFLFPGVKVDNTKVDQILRERTRK